jgi:hypothetical protein
VCRSGEIQIIRTAAASVLFPEPGWEPDADEGVGVQGEGNGVEEIDAEGQECDRGRSFEDYAAVLRCLWPDYHCMTSHAKVTGADRRATTSQTIWI